MIFKDLAAVQDQGGGEGLVPCLASAPGRVSGQWAQGPWEECGAHTLLQMSRCEQLKLNSSWYSLGITGEGASLSF